MCAGFQFLTQGKPTERPGGRAGYQGNNADGRCSFVVGDLDRSPFLLFHVRYDRFELRKNPATYYSDVELLQIPSFCSLDRDAYSLSMAFVDVSGVFGRQLNLLECLGDTIESELSLHPLLINLFLKVLNFPPNDRQLCLG